MLPETLIILTPAFGANPDDNHWVPAHQIFVKNLTKLYPDVQVIVLTFQYPEANSYILHGARIISFGALGKGKLTRWFTWIKVFLTLKRLNKTHQIIGLLSFWLGECALIGSLFARFCGISHFSWILGQDAKAGNRAVARTRPRASQLIALSDFIADEFNRNYSIRPQHVIPLGIDTESYPKGNFTRSMDVMGAGSLIPLKRYSLFISIINKVRQKIPGLKVVICGQGPEKEMLLKEITVLGLENSISLLDEVSHPEVLKQMLQSRLFLHTSEYEGFGMVCTEALGAGAQVISFCKPMRQEIDQWHIVSSEDEAVTRLVELLGNQVLLHNQVIPFPVEQTCTKIMHLFGKKLLADPA